MNIYIIGPVTGRPDDNRAEFERVSEKLWLAPGKRHEPITPFHMVSEARIDEFIDADDDITWNIAMKGCLMELLNHWNEWADHPNIGIAMLDGWEQSRGARIEHDLAVALGIPCRPWREWL